MASLVSMFNKAFNPTSSIQPVGKTSPDTLARVTGSYAASSGQYVLTAMSADDAIQWYERISIIYRCVDLIASTQMTVPIVVRGDYGRGEIQEDPHLYRLLNAKPNDYEDAASFRYRLSSIMLLDPLGVLVEVQRSAAGIPVALHIVQPGSWQPRREMAADGRFHSFVDYFEVRNAYGNGRLDRKDALWLKGKPHPSDPYRQMTPLTASRLSAETDYYARLFNRNFLVNDGRPGLLVVVKGDITEEDSEELRQRFSGGHTRAGLTTVIEGDGLEVRDLASSPRDIQWDAAVAGSKQDIMLAFGTPESVLGNASGRTFSNADSEWFNFWELTMLPHCNSITSGMDPLTGDEYDDYKIIHNYDEVPVLQVPKLKAEAESEARWKAGIITLNEHLRAIGREEIDEDYANVRFLHNNIIAGPIEMAKSVAKLPLVGVPDMSEMMMPAEEAPAEIEGGEDQLELESSWPEEYDDGNWSSVTQLSSGYSDAEAYDAELVDDETNEAEVKALESLVDRTGRFLEREFKSDPPYQREELELPLLGVLDNWAERQEDVIPSRMDHAKFREGTRFWKTEVETKAATEKPINIEYLLDRDRWLREIENSILRRVKPYAGQVLGDAKKEISRLTRGRVEDFSVDLEPLYQNISRVVNDEAGRELDSLFKIIEDEYESGAELEEMKQQVASGLADGRRKWNKKIAQWVAGYASEAVRFEAFSQGEFRKTWNTKLDSKVRRAHAGIHGVTVPASSPFSVDGYHMNHPGDIVAPIELTANCRCWLEYTL